MNLKKKSSTTATQDWNVYIRSATELLLLYTMYIANTKIIARAAAPRKKKRAYIRSENEFIAADGVDYIVRLLHSQTHTYTRRQAHFKLKQ